MSQQRPFMTPNGGNENTQRHTHSLDRQKGQMKAKHKECHCKSIMFKKKIGCFPSSSSPLYLKGMTDALVGGAGGTKHATEAEDGGRGRAAYE